VAAYVEAMDALDLKGGADAAWSIVGAANQFIVQNAPWTLAKNKQDKELDDVLGSLARALVRLAVLAHPYMPGKTAELWQYLGQASALSSAWSLTVSPDATGADVRKPDGLFPRPQPSTP
jgi:methionyl-tRNA synthetase